MSVAPTASVTSHAGFDPAPLGLGLVVPVLGAHPQSGASGVALAMADAAAAAGLRVLVVDCADPARSGLAGVAQVEGRSTASAPGRAPVRLAQRRLPRGQVEVRRIVGEGTPLASGSVPLPPDWVTAVAAQADLTVVDLGWDLWNLMVPGTPLGPLSWCLGAASWTRPVLVVRATAPGVALAEGVLARYRLGTQRAGLVLPAALAVVGARSWPAAVAAVLGFQLHQFAAEHPPIWFPHVDEVAVGGWGPHPVSADLVRAAAALLYGLGGPVAEAIGPPAAPRRGLLRRS